MQNNVLLEANFFLTELLLSLERVTLSPSMRHPRAHLPRDIIRQKLYTCSMPGFGDIVTLDV